MTFICDSRQIENDLRKANGTRIHGRLELDDLERFSDELEREIIVVIGKPATSDPHERVTLVVIIQQRRCAVAHAEETALSEAEKVKTFTWEEIDDHFPGLVYHLNEILHHMFRE
jgi:hypothetical protein